MAKVIWMGSKGWRQTTLVSLLVVTLASWSLAAPLTPGEPILLQKTQGRFDFLRIDTARHRLLLAHTGNKSLDVFDLDSRQLVASVNTGAAQDSAVDVKNGRYFVSVSSPPKMAIVDAAKLELIGEVPLPAAADLLAFNPTNGKAYVCNDTAPELWVIDPETKKALTLTVSGGGMEDLSFTTDYTKLFQVEKEANALILIDLANNKVLESWSTSPAASPHGMALVPHTDFLLVAGGNGKLVLMTRSGGKVVADADIAPRVDEITYDPQLRTVYCASGQGKISAVSLEGEKLTPLGDVQSTQGCHSIIVDPKTHLVWIAYAKGDQSLVQPFIPAGRMLPRK